MVLNAARSKLEEIARRSFRENDEQTIRGI